MNAEKLRAISSNYNEYCTEMVDHWLDLIARVKTLDKEDHLAEVNTSINRMVHYSTDDLVWNIRDYWATPVEMFSKGQGDCEDIAITKMLTLLEIGWDPDLLRLHYVNVAIGSGVTPHMVLAYHEDNDNPLIMDCMIDSIRPISRRKDLSQVYSFNATKLWVNNELTSALPRERMSKWNEFLDKISEYD